MRIGLYGGCFNPVHEGHLTAARGACDALGLDRMVLIPSGTPPLKGSMGLVDGVHRLAMLEMAVADDARLEVSRIEIDRAGPSFTVDTVRELRGAFPAKAELFFLLGDDCLDRLPQWKGIDELHAMLRFVLLPRSGDMPSPADSRLIWLDLPKVAASSTQVRAMLAAGRRPPDDLLPRSVAEYIRHHQLYGHCPEPSCA
jgi:nicotinate-nucleotide adenylyltransferase